MFKCCTFENDSGDKRFNQAVKVVLEHEGGLSTNKRDPGGVTKWGISLRFLRAAGIDIDGNGVVDEHDMLGLELPNAILIYRYYWWDKYNYDSIKSLQVATKVFDLSVNMGPKTAHRLLQIAINRLNDKPITVDGIIGPETLNAANNTPSDQLMNQLRACATHHYIDILARNPHMEWARNGWLNRAEW